MNTFDMLVQLRGGLPECCDFCGQAFSETRHPVPEEAGDWACSECVARWDAARAPVDALRARERESAMQALASMGQAQEAYEAQLEAEAELARLRDRERVLVEAATPYVQPVQNADYGRQLRQHEALVAALAQTPTDPGDGWTWHERLGWIGPDGKPADPRRRG